MIEDILVKKAKEAGGSVRRKTLMDRITQMGNKRGKTLQKMRIWPNKRVGKRNKYIPLRRA